ncbi:unnamed protein product, partial [Mesorhabditis spiculigera]
MLKLVTKLRNINVKNQDDEQPPADPTTDSSGHETAKQPLRKSARLSAKSMLHDSGTESDDEELERLEKEKVCDESSKNYGDFLNSRSPPTSAFLNSMYDHDSESWDSTGGESGITTGFESADCSRESTDIPTPPLCASDARRGAFQRTTYAKGAFEFPPMSMHNAGEKRRHSTTQTSPRQQRAADLGRKATRNRAGGPAAKSSPPNGPRDIIVAARRTPIRVLVNRQLEENTTPPLRSTSPMPIEGKKLLVDDLDIGSPPSHSLAKRGRTNGYGRPTLDLDKMLEHRLQTDPFSLREHDDVALDGVFYTRKGQGQGPQNDCTFRPVEMNI